MYKNMSASSISTQSTLTKGSLGACALPQAGVSQAAAGSTAPENIWVPFIKDTYPHLQKQTYFLPPLHFNCAPHSVEDIAGQTVRVIDNPSSSGRRRRQHPPPLPFQQVAGTVFMENPPTLEPLRIQDNDRQDDDAHRRSLQCLQDLVSSTPQVMMVLSQLKFRQYLDNKTNPKGKTNPLHAAAISRLPSIKPLPVNIADGECDILVIHRHHGFIIGEVKSVGGNQYFTNRPATEQDQMIVDKIKRAVAQLNNQERALRRLVSDMNGIRVNNGMAPITIIKTLMLPNITSGQLQHALATSTPLKQDLCQCLDSADVSQAVGRCLCSDQIAQPSTWWHNTVLTRGSDPGMTDVLYERLVARFCGPATTVEVATQAPPRKVIRTWGEAVAETGLRFSSLALTPKQVSLLNLLNPEPQYQYLQGPPGCGKTVVLTLKALQWLNQGRKLCLVSTTGSSRVVSALMQHQLVFSLGAGAATACIHQLGYQFDDNLADVSRAVNELMALDPGCAVIMDEIEYTVRDSFKDFVCEVSTQTPTMSVWAAGLWRLDHESSRPRPAQLHVKSLRVPLRCPPTINREVKQSSDIDGKDIPCYKDPAQPLTTEGPSVRWLYHKNQPGHFGYGVKADVSFPLECATCADNIADILAELGVGQQASSLEYRDVLILCGSGSNPCDADEMVERLRQHHLIPLTVMARPLPDKDVRELALATTDQVIVTDCIATAGLERRVVIGLGWGSVGPGRTLIMSRCTAYLCYIDPEEE